MEAQGQDNHKHNCKDCSAYDFYYENRTAYCQRYGKSIRNLRKTMDVERCNYFSSCKFCKFHCERRFEKDGFNVKKIHWCIKREKPLSYFDKSCVCYKEKTDE